MATSMQRYEEPLEGLTQWRPPEQVLAEAKLAADALTGVISLKKNPVKFNGEIYLEFEDWQTCAKFYGVTARVEETKFVDYSGVRGFEAIAVALDRTGAIISRAESLCLNDEENWGMVPKYEWRDELDGSGKKIWDAERKRYKGKRVQVGEVAKPLFQLKSMAQTRACSKVLRQVFAWIVVLAGYSPTPAEEMTGNEQFEDHTEGKKPPVTQPTRASEKKQPESTQQTAPTTDEVSGVIESAKPAKSNDGTLWLSGRGLLIMVPADKVDSDMKPGYFIKCRGTKKHSEKAGDYLILAGFSELSAVQEGEVKAATEPATDSKMSSDMAEVAEELFGDKTIENMKKSGQVTTASNLPVTTKPGTIGKKRAQRLYAIANQNVKTTGFTEENIEKVLAALPIPLGHLSDLEISMYETMEKICTGEEKWDEYLAE